MRVVLAGWESDAVPLAALCDLGLDVVVFTRWREGEPLREVREGVRIERCPHQIGGGASAEARSLGAAFLARDLEYGLGAGAVDVLHALDPTALAALAPLVERHPRAARVATVGAGEDRAPRLAAGDPHLLIADHPLVASALVSPRLGGGRPVATIPSLARLEAPSGSRGDVLPAGRSVVSVWAPRHAAADPVELAAALVPLRRDVPDLGVCALGAGPQAERLRRLLAARGLLVRPAGVEALGAPGWWNAAVARSSALLLTDGVPADEPAAWAAWCAGVPVVAAGPDAAAALRDALAGGDRTDRALGSGLTLARAQLDPPGVARRLLAAYLDALALAARGAIAPAPAGAEPAPAPALMTASHTRLDVIAVGPRELYATWHVRPDDRGRALAWLGADAARASWVLRFHDITAKAFHGHDPHHSWDVEVSPTEGGRGVRVESPGLSLAASLALKGPSGACLPLAYAPLLHLPRDEPAESPPDRRLRALGRAPGRDALPRA
jgi:hypothetical protein